jgi:Sap, sulfolipid-1-addressing protein
MRITPSGGWNRRTARLASPANGAFIPKDGSIVTLLQILPMAFVMIAGPQILSAIFLATSENWRRNLAAYIAGAALSITLIVTIAFFVGDGASRAGASNETLQIVVLVLLVAAALHTFVKRKESEPPKWMGKLQTATPRFSFRLGFLLLGVFPTDILTAFAVGSYLASHGEPWWDLLPFLALTLLFLGLPAILLLLFGQRAQAFMPKARDWMNTNSWVVSEIVIALFIVITANSLAG